MLLPYLSNGFGSDIEMKHLMVRWPRRIDWDGLYKSSDHPSTWILGPMPGTSIFGSQFLLVNKVTSVIVVFGLHDSYEDTSIACGLNNFNKKCVSTQALETKEENTAAVRCSFDLQTWGLQSAPIPWFFLGNGRCCKPWRCHLEHFFGPRPEKGPLKPRFF